MQASDRATISDERRKLLGRIRLFLILDFIFNFTSLFYIGYMFVTYNVPLYGLLAVAIAVNGGLLGLALWRVRQNDLDGAVLAFSIGLWGISLIGIYASPGSLSIFTAIVIWPVTVALPYISQTGLRRLMIVSTVVGVAVAALSLRPDSPSTSEVPAWIGRAVTAGFVALFIGVTFLLLWHYSKRLSDTLDQMKVANTALQESERDLEQKVDERTHELADARDVALESTRAKSAFLASMSHEIRTPMNAVIGMTSLLMDTRLNARQKDFVETIRTSSESLLTIINDILDFSKIEAGKLDLEQAPFDLRGCVESALDLVAVKAGEKQIELACLFDADIPAAIVSDVTRLRQVVLNLLSNAIKFTEKGEVVVSVHSRPVDGDMAEIEISVHDTGIGIPADRMNRLFQSFSQVDASTTRTHGGTGLGLVISQRLADLMGGKMWVESVPGEGSTFTFTIRAAVAESQPPTFLAANQPELTGQRVLIVDDNPTNRKVLRLQVESWGMDPLEVESGAAALDALRANPGVALAVLDMHMPEMDGLMLADAIRNTSHGKSLPLIMLTSLGHREDDPRVQHFSAFLFKPIKSSQLYNAFIEALATQKRTTSRKAKVKAAPMFNAKMAEELPLRILLAEDNAVNQKVALNILAKLGYRADVAGNGLEAVEAVERQRYDVILMDMQMPEMDGLDATRTIRTRPIDQPYIVAMTANAMAGDREACLEAGMDDYVSKPIYLESLVTALKNSAGSVKAETTPGNRSDEASDGAVNLTIFDDFVEDFGEEDAAALLQTYLRDTTHQIATMRHSLAENDIEPLQRAAHSLKSTSATMGAVVLGQMSAALEARCKAGDTTDAGTMIEQVSTEFDRVQAAMLELMDERGLQ